ncbi:Methyltransferase [Ceraceosorus bombacis]|uniref:Methyltransferase n=1 Tax=Ceraceosorus bombacis TaxID=401625 RepID=A0A0P1BTG1_9BASI|nr:Methyltransferase [Ceraceosorus bombacis]
MSAFSDPSFDFRRYFEARPRHSSEIYSRVLQYHQGAHGTLLDLGCGPGISFFPLAGHFERSIGTDPSQGMLDQGPAAWEQYKSSNPSQTSLSSAKVQFVQSSAEDLGGILPDQSVDLITAATAAHWFSYPQIWKELGRVLKPNGTVAFWTYGTNYLPQHPDLWPMMKEFMSSYADFLGPYWPQPGRRLLENLYVDIPFPEDESVWDTSSAERRMHSLSAPGVPQIGSPELDFSMSQPMSFSSLNSYFHTSSASSRYKAQHPSSFVAGQDKAAAAADMIDLHVQKLREAVLRQRAQGMGTQEGLDDDHVRVAWPLGLMMIRKLKQS